MRLRKLKLAGFKSFVDPTTLNVPGNLVAVVGPNGCGKSNVIDAVRWVMGESSAKNLRGESMADVIFNGSVVRKPVGQASVELVFENAEGRVTGQYAAFNEIAVRRQVSRDGQSIYSINGGRCRRKDVTDLFLGTGLGPRSYAIIEQGMITRVLEARPEELRSFLEEAAGISLYKERRHEAEIRMRHTRENLERLEDLRGELETQLRKLKRQADAAVRYKQLKAEERELKLRLLAARLRALDRHIDARQAELRRDEAALEERLAAVRRSEAELEREREAQAESAEALNRVQAEVYQAGAEVSRLEQAIRHARDQRESLEQDLEQVERSLGEARAQEAADRGERGHLEERAAAVAVDLEAARERAALAEAGREEADGAMSAWQADWEAHLAQAAEPERRAEVEKATLSHLDQRAVKVAARLESLDAERQGLDTAPLEAELALLEEQLAEARLRAEEAEQGTAQVQDRLAEERVAGHARAAELDGARGRVQSLRGRLESLATLQQAALGKDRGEAIAWLERQGLSEAQRLAEALQVQPGWERAVEVVLGDHVEAACVPGLARVGHAVGELEGGRVTLFDTALDGPGQAAGGESLLGKVRAPWPLEGLLAGILVAPDLAAAWTRYPHLAPGQSVVTPDGVWLGRGWCRVVRAEDGRGGVLAREQALRELRGELEAAEQQSEALAAALHAGEQRLAELEQERAGLQDAVQAAHREAGGIEGRLAKERARLEGMRSRAQGLEREHAELARERDELLAEAEAAHARLADAQERMTDLAEQRLRLERERDNRRQALSRAASETREAREGAHRLEVEAQTLGARLEAIGASLERASAQVAQWSAQREELSAALLHADDPIETLEAEREEWLARHLEVESRLAAARDRQAAVEARIRELDETRQAQEQAFDTRKATLQEAYLGLQEHRVRRETLLEQLGEQLAERLPAAQPMAEGGPEEAEQPEEPAAEAPLDVEAVLREVLAELPEEVDEAALQEALTRVGTGIQRLGAVNLAAIEEHRTESERKTYLDAQHADLMEALETLERAIRRIDRETRERFKATYEQVDAGLKQMFPRLFGGGEAYLELTDNDWLAAGVTIMARPPGKRNATIHQLSGGEKALTAVALVFAIFELNPAPFCLLDEVDAPLDDANVGRFSRMVAAMSERTQFLFVTHNKVTMEIAGHLTGVTMQEPGVSRLVAVDVDEAVELAAS